MRWTVDYKKDFNFATEVYKKLYPEKVIFLMEDIVNLLKKEPVLLDINKGIMRHEGYYKALTEENN